MIVIILFCCLCASPVILLIYAILDTLSKRYKTSNLKHNARMKFNSFVKMYYINPDKWNLFPSCVMYYPQKYNETSKIHISFNYIDWLRYKSWVKHKERHEEKIKEKQTYLKNNEILIQYLLNDIETFKETNEKETKRKIDELIKNIK